MSEAGCTVIVCVCVFLGVFLFGSKQKSGGIHKVQHLAEVTYGVTLYQSLVVRMG